MSNAMQFPVDATKAGLYEWTMTTSTSRRTGHVVVRGTQAGPIGNFKYAQGTETWYWAQASTPPGQVSFTLTLLLMRAPNDSTLVNAIGSVRNSETQAGVSPEVPTWTAGAPLGTNPIIVTLTSVTNGPGTYTQLYNHVSIQMPIDSNPLLPTWYTDIPGLYSVFGGSAQQGAPVAEGISATMQGVTSGNAGYPVAASWLWFGRTPT